MARRIPVAKWSGSWRPIFEAGAREVWYVYPRPRPEVWVYSSPEQYRVIGGEEVLTSAAVLPGFELDLKRLFSRGPGSTQDGP